MNRSRLAILAICLCCVAPLFVACKQQMNMDTVINEPRLSGTLSKAREGSILIKAAEGDEIRNSSDLISVSTDAELKGSMTEFAVGDEGTVYFDGVVAESYPAQVNKVYAIAPAKDN